jgi:ornithine carbamoyltransferase
VGFANGGNVFSISNNLCNSGAGVCQTFGGNVRIFFPAGTAAENNNFNISQNYNAFTGITNDKVAFNPERDALLKVEGIGNTIALGSALQP